jgi:hypothetical protein
MSGESPRVPEGFTQKEAQIPRKLEAQPKAIAAASSCDAWEKSAAEAHTRRAVSATSRSSFYRGKANVIWGSGSGPRKLGLSRDLGTETATETRGAIVTWPTGRCREQLSRHLVRNVKRPSRRNPALVGCFGEIVPDRRRWDLRSEISRRVGDRKLSADPFRQQIRNLDMARYRFRESRLRILPKRMLLAFSTYDATIRRRCRSKLSRFIRPQRALAARREEVIATTLASGVRESGR